jgi:hypothetical protein
MDSRVMKNILVIVSSIEVGIAVVVKDTTLAVSAVWLLLLIRLL